ncbi:hypothetical protein STEG23_028088, partial [Scotinomys teguina]
SPFSSEGLELSSEMQGGGREKARHALGAQLPGTYTRPEHAAIRRPCSMY